MESMVGVLNGFAALAAPAPFLAMLFGFLIGTFAISELLIQSERNHPNIVVDGPDRVRIRRRDFVPSLSEIREIGLFTYFKSAIIGFLIGVLPGIFS